MARCASSATASVRFCYLVTAPFVIRYLGVEQFGSYVAVLALIGVVALVSDAGLTLVGLREYANRDEAGRARLLDSLMALRLAVVTVGVAVACGFAAISGYAPEFVLGTALAGLGLLLVVVEQTCGIALASQLRFGAVTVLEVVRAALAAAGLLALVALGAGVTWLLAVSVPVSAVVALLARRLLRGHGLRPRFDRAEWRYLIREAIPVAIASTIGSLFYRSAIVVMSITATAAETSYFGASYRILEALIVIPGLLCATAFPILARAAQDDEDRTAFALQSLADVGLVLGTAAGLALALAARPIVLFLAGSGLRAVDPGPPDPGGGPPRDVPRIGVGHGPVGGPGPAPARDRELHRRRRRRHAVGDRGPDRGRPGRRGRDARRRVAARGALSHRAGPGAARAAARGPASCRRSCWRWRWDPAPSCCRFRTSSVPPAAPPPTPSWSCCCARCRRTRGGRSPCSAARARGGSGMNPPMEAEFTKYELARRVPLAGDRGAPARPLLSAAARAVLMVRRRGEGAAARAPARHRLRRRGAHRPDGPRHARPGRRHRAGALRRAVRDARRSRPPGPRRR